MTLQKFCVPIDALSITTSAIVMQTPAGEAVGHQTSAGEVGTLVTNSEVYLPFTFPHINPLLLKSHGQFSGIASFYLIQLESQGR